MRRFQSYHVSP
ncbi:hypothetical protein E2C01_073723 [Portunus trituberculatus]|uniref:Uncharacterized protein n=1 Tax=Portunus trituberculatus TaxID=210409 RepID=A0A5B7IE99_PORTR|nr:hypothetical protein [Portunus trituberculatus]